MKYPKMQNDRVLIKRLPEVEETRGGLIIPETWREKPMNGTVCSVGPGKFTAKGFRVPVDLKEGDTVMFARYAGLDIKMNAGEDYLIVREDEVLGVIA